MRLSITITKTVTTAAASDCQRYLHGTLAVQADRFPNGVDRELWTTKGNLDLAAYYADLAEQQALFAGGVILGGAPPLKAIVAFDLPNLTITYLEAQPEPYLYVQGDVYRFTHACAAVLNKDMRNIEVTYIE